MYVHRMVSKLILISRMQDFLRIQKNSLMSHSSDPFFFFISFSFIVANRPLRFDMCHQCLCVYIRNISHKPYDLVHHLNASPLSAPATIGAADISPESNADKIRALLTPKIALAWLPMYSKDYSCLTHLPLQHEFRDCTLFCQLL
jgi:hypothetical protein